MFSAWLLPRVAMRGLHNSSQAVCSVAPTFNDQSCVSRSSNCQLVTEPCSSLCLTPSSSQYLNSSTGKFVKSTRRTCSPTYAARLCRIQTELTTQAILLVGGFGENMYLQKILESTLHQGVFELFRLAARKSLHAEVILGQTSCSRRVAGQQYVAELPSGGLENMPSSSDLPVDTGFSQLTVASRIARRHYGVRVDEVFDRNEHLEIDSIIDQFDGVDQARHQMQWWIRRVGSFSRESSVILEAKLRATLLTEPTWSSISILP